MLKKETRTLTHLANQNENLDQYLNISVSHPDLHQGMGCDPCLRRTHAPRTSRSRFARTRVRTPILWWSHFAPAPAPRAARLKLIELLKWKRASTSFHQTNINFHSHSNLMFVFDFIQYYNSIYSFVTILSLVSTYYC